MKPLRPLAAASVLLAIFSGCGKHNKPEIGSNLANPVAVVALSTGDNVAVLNASVTGQYEHGSLSLYKVGASGLSHVSAVETPRLGSALAVLPSQLVAVSFLPNEAEGTSATIRFWDVSSPEKPQEKTELQIRDLPFTPGQMTSFTRAGKSYLVVGTALYQGYGLRAQSAVYEINGASSRLVFQTADMIYGRKYQKLQMGQTLPAWDEAHDLLVFFPRESVGGMTQAEAGVFKSADAWDWLTGVVDHAVSDLRLSSATVVDFGKVVAGGGVSDNTWYIPMAFPSDAEKAPAFVPSQPKDSAANTKYSLHARFSHAVAATSLCSASELTASQYPADTIWAVDTSARGGALDGNHPESIPEIYGFSGWDNVRAQINAPSGAAQTQYHMLKALSVTKMATNPSGNDYGGRGSLGQFANAGRASGKCWPAWNRIDKTDASGLETSRFQSNTKKDPEKLFNAALPVLGSYSFAMVGKYVVGASYTEDKLSIQSFDGEALIEVK